MNIQSKESHGIERGRNRRKRRWWFFIFLLFLFVIALCWCMLLLGNTFYPVDIVIRSLMGEKILGANFAINTIRFPRMVAGLFSGFAFGVAGYIFQTILRNPLANPNILGITSGSSAAAVFCITVLHLSQTAVSIAAIIAGFITVLIIYFLSSGNSFSIGRLIIVGIGMQAMLEAAISFLMIKSAQQDIGEVLRWLSGSLNGSKLSETTPLILAVLILTPLILLLSRHLSMLELGEQTATSLGVATDKVRITLMISSVVMIAIATATTGPIAFVSFLAGPIANRLVGVSSSSNILPAGLIGAVLVLGADLIGQFAFAYRFPVGVITGLLGAPYLIYLLIRMNRKGEL